MLYNSKVIHSGNYIEIYEYSDYQSDLRNSENEKVLSEFDLLKKYGEIESSELKQPNTAYYFDEETGEYITYEVDRTEEHQRRSIMNLSRLINSNIGGKRTSEKFYTLTFAENLQDRKKAIEEFNKFVYKLRRKFKSNIQYVAVIELQKRGAIHFHVLFFNLKFIKKKEVAELWGHGFVSIESVKNEKVASYLLKYLTKDFKTGREKGERRYLHSRGLQKPIVEKLENINIHDYIDNKSVVVAENSFESRYMGTIKYTRIYKQKKKVGDTNVQSSSN